MCAHTYSSIYVFEKISDCLIYKSGELRWSMYSGQWGSNKYHQFISVVVIELSVRCLNTGPEDRLSTALKDGYRKEVVWKPGNCYKETPYGNK